MNYQKKSYIIFYISNYSTYSASSKESWIMKKGLTENCCFHKQKINFWSFFSSNYLQSSSWFLETNEVCLLCDWISGTFLHAHNLLLLEIHHVNIWYYQLLKQQFFSKYKVCLHVTWSTYLVFQEEFLKIQYLNGDGSGNWERKF